MKYKLALGAVIVALAVIVAVYFSLNGRRLSSSANAAKVTQATIPPGVGVNDPATGQSKTPSSRQPVSKGEANYAALYATAIPMQTVINADYGWRIRHGYSLGLYANYDDATLKKMATNGDPLAQSAWFMRLNKGQSIDPPVSDRVKKWEIQWKIIKRNYRLAKTAILNGVTNPNLVASFVFENPQSMNPHPSQNESLAEENSNVVKSETKWSATVILSEMRGDPSISRGHNLDVMNIYRGGLNLLFDPLMRNLKIGHAACKLARSVYDQAQAERIAQGQGAFDNNPPKYVIGNSEPFPAVSICQDEWPGPTPQCTQTWIQSPALVDGSPTVIPGWECSSNGN